MHIGQKRYRKFPDDEIFTALRRILSLSQRRNGPIHIVGKQSPVHRQLPSVKRWFGDMPTVYAVRKGGSLFQIKLLIVLSWSKPFAVPIHVFTQVVYTFHCCPALRETPKEVYNTARVNRKRSAHSVATVDYLVWIFAII